MDSIGNNFRSERLRRGLSLEQVEKWTKIGKPLLQAIEANRFEQLPGGLFTRSFIRQYARTLDLDQEQIIQSYKEHFEAPPPEPAAPSRKCWPRHSTLMPRFGWLVVTLFVCGGLSSLWNAKRAADRPKTLMHPGEIRSSPSPLLHKEVQPHWQVPIAAESRPLAESAQTNRPLSPRASGDMHVVLFAKEPVWISIACDGNQVYTGTLEGQENKELEASGKLTALIGNAGGMELSLNGKLIGPLGKHGQVRLLELTSDGARFVSRTE